MNVWVNIDEAAQAKLDLWMAEKQKTIHQGMRTLGATVCRAFYEYTWPRENAKSERRVVADVNRVYASQSRVYEDIKNGPGGESAADAFWYFCGVGKWGTAKKILQTESPKYKSLPFSKFDGGALHKRARNAKGSVPKGFSPKFVVQDRGKNHKLAAHSEKQAQTVGMAKAGWVQAWRGLAQPRGVPEWVKRHKKQLGESEYRERGANTSVTVWNKVRYADGAISDKYQEYIVKNAVGRFVEYLDKQLRFK